MLSFRLEMPSATPTGVIVAVHGLTESAACLEAAFPAWTAQGFAVLAMDLRGHGSSPRWAPEQLRQHPGDVMLTDVTDVLASSEMVQLLGKLPLLFYGHSAGGAIAAAAAADIVESEGAAYCGQEAANRWRVAGVLLEDPFWRLPVTQYQDRSVAEAAYTALRSAQTLTAWERHERRRAEWPGWNDAEIMRSCRAQAETDLQLVRNGNVIPSRPWPEVLHSLREAAVPILIVTGTDRTGITPDHQDLARSHGARVEVVPGVSHFVRRDAPEVFMQTASTFFGSCNNAAANRIS